MNRIYRLIWSELAEAWIAVAENVRAHGKQASGVLLLSIASSALAGALPNTALPTGGAIVGGGAAGTIADNGNHMVVTQNAQSMIVSWSTFDIGSASSVQFLQPTATSIALNRVLSQDPSQIFGTLSANGRIMLLNPAGIVFGSGAQVNVGSLVASTLAISDGNFLSGNYSLGNSGSAGSVVNRGRIVASDGGVVAFIAPLVSNEGRIETPKGTALLAAADKVNVDFKGDGLISYSLDVGTAKALVDNSGSIAADGGVAVLTAKAADAVHQAVVNNTGLVRARTLDHRGGRILLLADMDNGETRVGGELDASAPNGGDGGFIETSGHVVTMGTASIDAGSTTGAGGTWLIDPQDLTIDATGAGNIASAINTGTSVTATTSACNTSYGSCSGSTGNLTLASSIAKTSGGAATLTLIADGYLQINSGVTVSDTSSSALSLNLQAAGPIRFADNSAMTRSVDVKGGLYLGGKSAGATYATGSAAYLEGIYIGNNSSLTAGSMTLYGQGKAGAAGVAGGTGVKLGSGASLAATGAIGVTGIGGQGGNGVSAGSSGGKGGTGSQGGAGTAGDSGAAGGAGITVGNTASIVADSVALTGSGGQGGAGRTGGQGGQGGDSDYAGPGDRGGMGGTGGAGGAGGSGGIGIGLASVTVSAATGVNLSGTGGVGGVGGVGGSGGRGGYANWADYAGTGGTGGKGGKGGAAAIGVALANGISIASSAGAVSITSASTAGAGGDGGDGGGGGDCHEALTTCAGGGSSNGAGAAGAAAFAFNAAGTGYIGAANGGSSSADISFINDSMSLGSLAVASSGTLSVRTKMASTLIDLGAHTTNSTHLQLGQSAFWNGTSGNFRDGFSSITVGSTTQSGAITIGTLSYSDALTLQTSGAVSVSGSVTTNDQSLTVSGASYTQSDVDIVAGSGDIVIAADAVALNTNAGSNALQTTGALALNTKTASTAVSLVGSAAFDLNSTEIGYIKNSGASSITLGRNDATGAMTIGNALNLAGKNVTLAAGSITDGGNNRVITADTLNLFANGAIGGSGTNYAIDILANTVSANTTGNANAYLTSTAGYALGASNVGTGTLSLATTGSGGSIVQSGAVTAGTLTATLAGTNSRLDFDNNENAISNLAGITAGGGFGLDNGNNATTLSGNITTSSGNGAVSIDTGSGTYTQNDNVDIASGSGAITLTADNMVINSNSGNNAFTTTGALTLQVATALRGITLGGDTEIAGQLTLQNSEFPAFSSNTPSSITIGRADGTGTMTIGGALGLAGKTLNLKAGSITDGNTTNRVVTAGTLNLLSNGNIGGIGDNAIDFVASTVSANTTDNGSAYLISTGGYTLGATNLGGGTLSLGAGGAITQSGAATGAALKLAASGQDVILNNSNSFGALNGAAGNLTLSNAQGIAVGATTISGNLNLTSGGNVTASGALSVGGWTTLNAGTHDVSLDYAGSDFAGAVAATAKDLRLLDANALELGDMALSGNLNVTAAGAITQQNPASSVLSVTGTTTLAGNDITLASAANDFVGAVSVSSGRDVQITDAGELHLGSANVRKLTTIAGGTAGTGDLYFDSGATISASNDGSTGDVNSVVLVSGDAASKIVNNAGANAVKLTGGNGSRWLVYTNDPYHNSDVFGGLKSYNEAIYGTHYTGHAVASGSTPAAPASITQPGNRYVLKVQSSAIPGYDPNKVTVTAIDVNKTYGDAVALTTADNTAITYAQGSMSFAEFSEPKPTWLDVTGLTLSSGGTGATAHVGNYAVTVSGMINAHNIGTLGLGGTTSWNYNDGTHFVNFNDSSSVIVTPRTLTLWISGGTVAGKVYDGTTSANFSVSPTFTLGNTVNSDAVAIDNSSVIGQFADKSVGANKAVTLSGLALVNNSYGDYVLSDVSPTYSGDITARSITVAATGKSKTYDATDVATATLTASSTVAAGTVGSGSGNDSVIDGDHLEYAYTGAVFDAGKNAGDGKAVTVRGISIGGEDAGNYVLADATATTTADIAKRSISLFSLTGSKEYDGTTALSSATLVVDSSGVLGSDVITGASGSARFDTRNAGTGKTLTADLSTLTLSGDDAGNYTLGSGSYSGSGTITSKAVTLTAGGISKGYDATTGYAMNTAELAALSTQLGVAGDTIGAATLSYADANAGNGKTVTFDAVSVADGNGGGNYAITLVGNNSSAIDKALINVSASSVVKTYDGTTGAAANGVVVSGRLYGTDTLDDSTLAYTFSDKNAGRDKTVIVSGSAKVVDGNNGDNYTINLVNNTSSIINKAALTVTASTVSKVFDGTTDASGTAGVGTLVSGDAVGNEATQRFADKNVGTGKTVTASGLLIVDGSNSDMTGNYDITYLPDTNSVILPSEQPGISGGAGAAGETKADISALVVNTQPTSSMPSGGPTGAGGDTHLALNPPVLVDYGTEGRRSDSGGSLISGDGRNVNSGSSAEGAAAIAGNGAAGNGATATAGDGSGGAQDTANDGTTGNGSSSSGASVTGQNKASDSDSPVGMAASEAGASNVARAGGNDAEGNETMTSAGDTPGDSHSPVEQGRAGNADGDINTPSGNRGDSRAGGQTQDVASANSDGTTQSSAPQSATSTSGGSDTASPEAGNAFGSQRNNDTATVKEGGQLGFGSDDGAQTAQFSVSGNTTTLTFGATSTSGGQGEAEGPTGGAGDGALSGTVIPLFSQSEGKVTPSGALRVVEQGQSLRASSVSVDTVSAPRLNPATMRYVSVDYRLPSGTHSPIAVGVSPEGVLVVGVSAAIKTTMDDRSIVLLGIYVARDRLDVKLASVTGVLIQVDGAAGSNSLLHVKATNPADLAVPGLGIDVGAGRVTVALLGKQVDGRQIAKGGASVAMAVATLGAKGEVTSQSSIVATDAAGSISVEDITGVPAIATAAPGPAESGISFAAMSGRDGASLPFEVGVAGNALVIRAQNEASSELMRSQRNVVIGVAIAQLNAKRGVAHDRIETVYLTSGR